jgi:hypothetical protein
VIPLGRWLSVAIGFLVRPIPVPLVAIIVCVVVVTVLIFRSGLGGEEPSPWLSYRQDTFLGVTWRWDYVGSHIAEHTIAAFCPQCEMRLRAVPSSYRTIATMMICDACDFRKEVEGTPPDIVNRVARLIERELNRSTRPPQM